MKKSAYLLVCILAASFVFSFYSCNKGQKNTTGTPDKLQTTGTPGNPDATTTIDGKQIPAPAPPFGGLIKDEAKDSKPWWAPRIAPPKGAPNVLLIMTDDAGYGVSGTFGGVIPTPTMDKVAKNGLRYTQMHSTALCSPSRAAIITGRNHHSVGFGVVSEQATGFPGYDAIIGIENATVGKILRDNGYSTSWFGKNHNTPTYLISQTGPFDQWPNGMGFEYYYGFMGGESDQYTPNLYRNTNQIYPWLENPNYNLVTGMADDAIEYMDKLNAILPDKPFFVYYVPGATHAPHQPTQEWRDKFKGKFDMGWNVMREEIFANQKRLGVIPANTQLTPWPDDLPKWETLTPDEKKLYAVQAENFAAYVAYADYEIGRVIQKVEDMGRLDNTLIFYITGDNGTSAEGSLQGTPFDLTTLQGIDVPVADQLKYLDVWGTNQTQPHMSVAWSWAFDTPFKWTKQVASHFGGTRQGMCISWPNRIKDFGGIRTQFHHFIDIVPTILEATGIQAPQTVEGIPQKPIEGVSMAYTWDKANANAPTTRKTQYFEMFCNRGIYNDGWYACTTPPEPPWFMGTKALPDPLTGYKWELYNISEDFSQNNDLAAKEPDKLKEMEALFMKEAAKYQVLPLDNSILPRVISPKPSNTAGRSVFTYSGPIKGIDMMSAAASLLNKSYTITAEVDVPQNANGMIFTEGGRFGGVGLYLLNGKPIYTYNFLNLKRMKWNGTEALSAGKHTLVYDFKYSGPGFGKGGTGTLSVDGKEVATNQMPHTIPFLMNLGESMDIGSDTRTGVDDQDYQVPFTFNGKILKVVVKIGPEQLADADIIHKNNILANVNY
ncbi:MAG TPA: arylsulfatase [Ignavibacteria bacterium]|nr:arylsulfatase [Ignavibacteria bacterium]